MNSASNNTIETCEILAQKGELAIKNQNSSKGIKYLERALLIGTDDQKLLAALYSQLGNAHFALRDYNQARLYNISDLNTSRALGDEVQQAKAYSNLSSTYTMIHDFANAIVCSKNVVQIGNRLGDESIECRGHYNLALAYLQCAVAMMRRDAENAEGEHHHLSVENEEQLARAVDEFEKCLEIAQRQNDQILCGLALGNIGNAYFLAQKYAKSIDFYEKRLSIAKMLDDKASIRRTLSNIAKAQLLEEDFVGAQENYRSAIELAKENDCDDALLTQLKTDLAYVEEIMEKLTESEVGTYSPSKSSACTTHTQPTKMYCDASLSPVGEASFIDRTSKSLSRLDIGKPRKNHYHRINALFGSKSDGKGKAPLKNNAFLDLIEKVEKSEGKRYEDQDAVFAGCSQASLETDANTSHTSSNKRHSLRGKIGSLKGTTMKSLSSLKNLPGKRRHRLMSNSVTKLPTLNLDADVNSLK